MQYGQVTQGGGAWRRCASGSSRRHAPQHCWVACSSPPSEGADLSCCAPAPTLPPARPGPRVLRWSTGVDMGTVKVRNCQ